MKDVEVLQQQDPKTSMRSIIQRITTRRTILSAVMAACAVVTVSHDVETMSPKFGLNAAQ